MIAGLDKILFDTIIARHGGVDAFDALQIEYAGVIVQSILDMRSVSPAERLKLNDCVTDLFLKLPPRVSPKRERGTVNWSKMTLQAAANLYSKVIGDVDADIDDYLVPREETVPGARPAGQAAASAIPPPAPASLTPPVPPGMPPGKAAEGSARAGATAHAPRAPELAPATARGVDFGPFTSDPAPMPDRKVVPLQPARRPTDYDPRLRVFSIYPREETG
jgi:hypothetical protein